MGERRKYSQELKLQAVKLHLEDCMSSYAIARKLDVVSPSRVQDWIVKYKKYGARYFEDKQYKSHIRTKTQSPKEFRNLKEENEYLKAKLDFYEAIINLNVKKK